MLLERGQYKKLLRRWRKRTGKGGTVEKEDRELLRRCVKRTGKGGTVGKEDRTRSC